MAGLSGGRNLREWQRQFLDAYIQRRANGESIFSFEATMGAGKSMLFSELGRHMIEEEGLDFVVALVPWEDIRGDEYNGMVRDFNDAGLFTRTELFLSGTRVVSQHPPRPGTAFILTYQAACREHAVELLKKWVRAGKRFGFLPDEIHHTSTEAGSWGPMVEEIQRLAVTTACGSGTYFRTDRTRIRFLSYNEFGRPDLSVPAYSYSDGVRDRVVRPVAFRYFDPTLDCSRNRRPETHQLSSLSQGYKLNKAKQVVLDPSGATVREIIENVHAYLGRLRTKFPDAAVLFSCQPSRSGRDTESRYVHQIAEAVQEITREPVLTVVSSDAQSSGKLERFRNDSSPYLVAINKVSEGVNIPRLRGVALFRYMESEMQFRQICGRALRYTSCEDGTAAMVWLPKFAGMYAMALNMYGESLEGVRDLLCPTCGEHPCECPCRRCGQNPCECVGGIGGTVEAPDFEVIEAVPEAGGGSVGDDAVGERWIEVAQQIKERFVSHSHANEVQLAHALQVASRVSGEVVHDAGHSPMAELAEVKRRIQFFMGRVVGRFFNGDWSRAWSVLFRDRYGTDYRDAAITWPTSRLVEFAEVLKDILTRGEL